MKIPKSIIHSIYVGIAAANFVACTEEVITPQQEEGRGIFLSIAQSEDCPANKPDPCPACGLG